MRSLLAVLALSALTLVPGAGAAASEARPAFGDLSSPIRPGASMGGCTLNFVYYDSVLDEGQAPVAFIGTAGHCTDELGDRVSVPGVGEIGTVVYDSDVAEHPVDFTLIELDEARVPQTNPTMLGWDGPHGVATTADYEVGDLVDIHGYGMVWGDTEQTRDRQGVLVGWNDDEYAVNGPIWWGDSGSPLLLDKNGYAFGIVSRLNLDVFPYSSLTGPQMGFIFDALAVGGFGDVVMATAG